MLSRIFMIFCYQAVVAIKKLQLLDFIKLELIYDYKNS